MPLQAIMAFLRGMLACPVGTAANETETIRRFVGDMMQPERRSISWLRVS